MPRTPEQNKQIREKTTHLILEHALKLFSIKGFHGTTIADIAKSAGISKGLAYNYFSSKTDLVTAIFEQLASLSKDFTIAAAEISDPYEKLKFTLFSMLEFVDHSEDYWRIYISFVLQPEIVKLSDNVMKQFFDDIIRLMEDIFRELEVANPEVEARILGGMFDGIILHYYIDRKNYPLKEVMNRILKMYSRENIERMKPKA